MKNLSPTLKDHQSILRWINLSTGYGCIRPDEGDAYIFVEIDTLERAGLSVMNEGQRVSYHLVTENGMTSAVNVKLAEPLDNNHRRRRK